MNGSDLDDVEVPEDASVIKIFPGASFLTQLQIMLKISFIRKVRAPTIWLEVSLPLLFLVFVCLFASRARLWTDPLPNPEVDQYIPFAKIPGPSPQYGMIPDTPKTRAIMAAMQATSLALDSPNQILDSSIFFDNFEDYRSWIAKNRKVGDTFFAVNWSDEKVGFSTNGLTLDSLPDFVRTIMSAALLVEKQIQFPRIYFEYSALPSDSVFKSEDYETIEIIIFSTVLFIPPILTGAVNFGTEAESGLRDLLLFYGLSPSVNRVRWYLECFSVSFVLSLPFAIAISGLMGLSFWLLLVHFFLATGSMVSFTFALISLWPTQAMGRVVGLGILMSFFLFFFWAVFSWMFIDDGYYEKRILSIFPSASIPYTLAQIVSGHCMNLGQARYPKYFPVRLGFAYMAVETVVYYLFFILADTVKDMKWFRAQFRWGKQKPHPEITPIVIDKIAEDYDDVRAVDGISFSIEVSETLAIVGPNGAGKSTLLGILAGCHPPASGEIRFLGIDLAKDIESAHRMIGYCPQQNLFMDELTAPEWTKALSILRGTPDFDCSELFSALGLNEQLEGRMGDLSGGNKRKVCLASSLIGNPPIIILDEATSGVDFTSRTRMWSLIAGLKDTTVIMATHTLEECEKIADRIMVLVDGVISVLDTPTALRQRYKCGYLIETDQQNVAELETVMKSHGIGNPEIELTDERVRVVVSAEGHGAIAGILRDLKCEYHLSIQNLEEQIFSHVQHHEMEVIRRRESKMEIQDEELHTGV
jgi:ABC-type multidrug transport system ATPase subunit